MFCCRPAGGAQHRRASAARAPGWSWLVLGNDAFVSLSQSCERLGILRRLRADAPLRYLAIHDAEGDMPPPSTTCAPWTSDAQAVRQLPPSGFSVCLRSQPEPEALEAPATCGAADTDPVIATRPPGSSPFCIGCAPSANLMEAQYHRQKEPEEAASLCWMQVAQVFISMARRYCAARRAFSLARAPEPSDHNGRQDT